MSRIKTTSARMMKAYYHAAIGSVTAILCKVEQDDALK